MKKIILYFLMLLSLSFMTTSLSASEETKANLNQDYKSKSVSELFGSLYESTGLNAIINPQEGLLSHGTVVSTFNQSVGRLMMMAICFVLFYLAIAKGFEPLLLIPIAFGGFLANIPLADIAGPDGFLGILFNMGVSTGLFPIIIFMGVGAMTDFGPLLANPKTALLGGAAQFGIFGTIVGAAALSQYTGIIDFSLKEASAIGIIGGADGPTSIFVASKLAPDLLGAIAVAAYSYMALVPIIQPPIMKALTTKAERQIKMEQLREVSKLEKIVFPLTVMVICILVLPDATPLVGALTFGNFVKESGMAKRLSDTMENSLINIVTIFLGLSVGSKLAAEKFLVPETLGIIVLGLVAFSMGTAGGVIMAKIMNKFSTQKINPLIGSAGVSAVPMAARVSNKEGMKEDPTNMLLMHAMGPNVAGVIGSAVAAGILLSIFK
ncbi:sodium ion-translocating decarboxylase subunit beta [Sulfurospirillum barnesii]|uniref:Sodium ion-translocating decarboxylase, beta subunit n=1 Tax=Sulfurospirillum barnesii (strain ATCC 700032 / DSM 10660 / SES-3) TaxID=760154 RepID=I3XVJ3_SULBS|nr:sodium ion-translocating decarboxylase subunit beta [Sulfurospirillum barnesii]AFL67967.1 sodium ion-translocating decarboxylase, beta subunit [Sulfurospirillum barnesii SES-3]